MPFTEKERREWHEARKNGESTDDYDHRSDSMYECLHCGNPFPPGRGIVTADAAICDICN